MALLDLYYIKRRHSVKLLYLTISFHFHYNIQRRSIVLFEEIITHIKMLTVISKIKISGNR
jgi:hypothetical protein